jgi:hypothetical protein
MCLVVASHESKYFNEHGNLIRMPLRELYIDCKGSVIVNSIKGTVDIEIGEIKSDSDYSTAIHQLGISLGCMKWLVQSIEHFESMHIRLIGTVIVRANAALSVADERNLAEHAQKHWGIELRFVTT